MSEVFALVYTEEDRQKYVAAYVEALAARAKPRIEKYLDDYAATFAAGLGIPYPVASARGVG